MPIEINGTKYAINVVEGGELSPYATELGDGTVIHSHADPAGIWISPTGNDTGAGTESDPYETLDQAVSDLQAMGDPSGTIVYCKGGEYSPPARTDIDGFEGSAGNPVQIRAAPGENPVFNYSTTSLGQYDGAWRVGGSNTTSTRTVGYLEVTGIEIRENGEFMGLEVVGGAEHVTFSDCRFLNNYHSGVNVNAENYLDDIHFVDCEAAYHSGTGGSSDGFRVDLDGTGNSVTFTRCYAHHNTDDGFDLFGGDGELLEYCVAYRNGYADESSGSPHASSGGNAGFKMSGGNNSYRGSTAVKCIALENNNATPDDGYGFSDNMAEESVTYHHCTAHNNQDSFWFSSPSGSQSQARNCIAHSNDNGDSPTIWHSDYTASADELNCTWTDGITDPLFVSEDPFNEEYLVLSSGSPCIDAGTTTDVDTVTYSYGGSSPDIGTLDYNLAETVWVDISTDRNTVQLDASQSQSGTLRWPTETGDIGSYTATVRTEDDNDTAFVTVEEPFSYDPGTIVLINTDYPAAENGILYDDAWDTIESGALDENDEFAVANQPTATYNAELYDADWGHVATQSGFSHTDTEVTEVYFDTEP